MAANRRKGLARINRLSEDNDPEAAGFYLQQATEKFLKAFLLSKGWQLERIHDLEPLLNEALKYDGSLEHFRETLQKITAFYMVERYPFVSEIEITEQDVNQASVGIEGLVAFIRNTLKNQLKQSADDAGNLPSET